MSYNSIVSILTGPEEPVLLLKPKRAAVSTHCVGDVSILTGPEEPVLLVNLPPLISGLSFNPHRPRRAGATRSAIQTICAVARSFNPHRPRRAGATAIL